MKLPISQGRPITPNQLVAQWRNLPHKFQVNLWDFEVKAAKSAQSIFKKSFDMKKFNSSDGIAWASRSDEGRYKHPLMTETGSLKKSINWKRLESNGDPRGVTIYTDPNGFVHTKRHRGFCFAAVHNGPSSFRSGRVRNMPRRQFMGHSTVLEDKLKELSVLIFKGFPK